MVALARVQEERNEPGVCFRKDDVYEPVAREVREFGLHVRPGEVL